MNQLRPNNTSQTDDLTHLSTADGSTPSPHSKEKEGGEMNSTNKSEALQPEAVPEQANATGSVSEAAQRGLTDSEVEASRARHGHNVLTPPRRTSLWLLYLDKYRDPIIRILLVAVAVSLILAMVEGEYIETIGIAAAVLLATTVGFYFERDAVRRFDLLVQVNEDQMVKVRRNGRVTAVPRRDVVVGDIIIVETGDEIPADAHLFSATGLEVNESALTGEPLTHKYVASSGEKRGDAQEAYPPHMLLRSTMVLGGRGEAIVTAVGDATEIGHVAQQATEAHHTQTPLNRQLEGLAKTISQIGSVVAVAAFLLFLARDVMDESEVWQNGNLLAMLHQILTYFMMAVTLIVMAVPEGLPMAVTLALALNMRRMLRSNILVRKLHASETMGAVTVICTDKTGTLTQNRMQVAQLLSTKGTTPQSLQQAMAANSTAEVDGDTVIGNPTEGALLLWMRGEGVDYRLLRQEQEIVARQPFSTERKMMSTTVRCHGTIHTYIKGAPETILRACRLTPEERAMYQEQLLRWQQQAMRTLALAYYEGEGVDPLCADEVAAHPYTLQAIVAIADPLRPDVPAAVEQCRGAGIEVKVVTGDTVATAQEIARQIGIISGDETEDVCLSGEAFSALSDEEAAQAAQTLRVMYRARPTDKQRLVRLLQETGQVVAVTGDGTNDAPALNRAHVGLSLGSGTSVAKEASDITLIDDSFGSIVNAVMWGRSLYKNIQRFIYFQLVVNVAALLTVLAASMMGHELPLTVTQILWVNIIMDTFAALALASLPPSSQVLREPPRSPSAFIITRSMGWNIVSTGVAIFLAMGTLMMWLHHQQQGAPLTTRQLTWFFTAFVLTQFWNLLNAKCLGSSQSAFHHLFRDRGMLFVLGMILAGQWLIVTFGGIMFRTTALSLGEWGVLLASTSVVLWMGEVHRWIKRLRER